MPEFPGKALKNDAALASNSPALFDPARELQV
jgi:hypothetical protein